MEFKINELLTTKYENGITEVYINNKRIKQCKLLIINIPKKKRNKFQKFNSVDELIQFAIQHGLTEENYEGEDVGENNIKPEEEFWAHTSALQAWTEFNYNTELLDMRLAFPLLKELSKAGDSKAKKAFKDELYRRFNSGYDNIIIYLIKEGYLQFFTYEEFDSLLQETDMTRVLMQEASDDEIKQISGSILESLNDRQINIIFSKIKKKEFRKLKFSEGKLRKIPKSLLSFENLEYLNLNENKLVSLPNDIDKLDQLRHLELMKNKIRQLPNSIGNLKNLKYLNLMDNEIVFLPNSIKKLKNLNTIYLSKNHLSSLPKSFFNLKKLININLSDNRFSELPSTIFLLKELKILAAANNKISKISTNLKNLGNLEMLNLSRNKIEILPTTIGELTNLEILFLDNNDIKKLPDNLSELKNLKKLRLKHNKLKKIPKDIKNLLNLEDVNLSNNPLQKFPREIFKLPKLKYLHLSNNNFDPPKSFLQLFDKRTKSKNDVLYIRKRI